LHVIATQHAEQRPICEALDGGLEDLNEIREFGAEGLDLCHQSYSRRVGTRPT
jgi:hypothetical protein